MNIYYCLQNDQTWRKGSLESIHGGRIQVFSGEGADTIQLSNSEILFHSRGFTVSGYKLLANEGRYDLISVEVRTQKPRA